MLGCGPPLDGIGVEPPDNVVAAEGVGPAGFVLDVSVDGTGDAGTVAGEQPQSHTAATAGSRIRMDVDRTFSLPRRYGAKMAFASFWARSSPAASSLVTTRITRVSPPRSTYSWWNEGPQKAA